MNQLVVSRPAVNSVTTWVSSNSFTKREGELFLSVRVFLQSFEKVNCWNQWSDIMHTCMVHSSIGVIIRIEKSRQQILCFVHGMDITKL